MLLLLRRRVARPLPPQPQAAAEALRQRLAPVYLYGRRLARETALERLVAEFSLFEEGVVLAPAFESAPITVPSLVPDIGRRAGTVAEPKILIRPSPNSAADDLWRSQRAARGYAKHWLEDMKRAEIVGMLDPQSAAIEKQAWRLALGAGTEMPEAFNKEREIALKQVAAEHPELAQKYVRVWDSALEKNTCDDCANAHGSWVPMDQDFPLGTPGNVHNKCHCEDHVEPLDWNSADNRA